MVYKENLLQLPFLRVAIKGNIQIIMEIDSRDGSNNGDYYKLQLQVFV
jgi:hypothetical protein